MAAATVAVRSPFLAQEAPKFQKRAAKPKAAVKPKAAAAKPNAVAQPAASLFPRPPTFNQRSTPRQDDPMQLDVKGVGKEEDEQETAEEAQKDEENRQKLLNEGSAAAINAIQARQNASIPKGTELMRINATQFAFSMWAEKDESLLENHISSIRSLNESITADLRNVKWPEEQIPFYAFPVDRFYEFFLLGRGIGSELSENVGNAHMLAQGLMTVQDAAKMILEERGFTIEQVVPDIYLAELAKLCQKGMETPATGGGPTMADMFEKYVGSKISTSQPTMSSWRPDPEMSTGQATSQATSQSTSQPTSSLMPELWAKAKRTDKGFIASQQKVGRGRRVIFNQGTAKYPVYVSISGKNSGVEESFVEAAKLVIPFAGKEEVMQITEDDITDIVQVNPEKSTEREPITFLLVQNRWVSISRVANMLGSSLESLRENTVEKLLDNRDKIIECIEEGKDPDTVLGLTGQEVGLLAP